MADETFVWSFTDVPQRPAEHPGEVPRDASSALTECPTVASSAETSVPMRVASVTDNPPPAAAVAVAVAPGVLLGQRYMVLQPLPVRSGEADLWIIEDLQASRVKRLLKLYRFGLKPKLKVQEAVRALDSRHVVAMLEVGSLQGRPYEIQEFIVNGSLAEFLRKGPVPPAAARDMLSDLAASIAHLHAAKIIHRDIKPSNILVRSISPLNLVLTDFGISSALESDDEMHMTTVNRTIIYSAPEALTGVISEASDWWSLGVVLLEALMGRHPLSGINSQMANYHLVTQGIPVPETLPWEWQTLFAGLLSRDPRARWGHPQITAWLAGKFASLPAPPSSTHLPASLAPASAAAPWGGLGPLTPRPSGPAASPPPTTSSLFGSTTPSPAAQPPKTTTSTETGRAARPYRFAGGEFHRAADLAQSMAWAWADALRHFEHGAVQEWIQRDLGDYSLIVDFEDMRKDSRLLTTHHRMAVALMLMNPAIPLLWKGETVTPEWLAAAPGESTWIVNSSLPMWHERLRRDRWLLDLHNQRESVLSKLSRFGEFVDRQLAAELLNQPASAIHAAAAERQRAFASARHIALDELLHKPKLEIWEAVALAVCSRRAFLTTAESDELRQQARNIRLRAMATDLRMYHIEPDETLLAQLLELPPPEIIAQAQKIVAEAVTSTNARLASLLKKPELSLTDALALLCAPPATLLDANQTQENEWRNERREVVGQARHLGLGIDAAVLPLLIGPDSTHANLLTLWKTRHEEYSAALDPFLQAMFEKSLPTTRDMVLIVIAPPARFRPRIGRTLSSYTKSLTSMLRIK